MKVTNRGKKGQISPLDWEYMEQRPHGDPGFDPEHNKRVIAETIKWTEDNRRKKDREYSEQARQRASAITSYLFNLSQGKGVSKIDEYFGKRELARLRGEEIIGQLKADPALVEKLKQRYAGQQVRPL